MFVWRRGRCGWRRAGSGKFPAQRKSKRYWRVSAGSPRRLRTALTRDCFTMMCRGDCHGCICQTRGRRFARREFADWRGRRAGADAATKAARAQGDRLMEAKWMPEAVAFAVALGCVFALVPLIQRMCVRFRIFDQPGDLKIHAEPIPRLGGVGIALALAAGVAAASHSARGGALFIAAALGLVWLAGFCGRSAGTRAAISFVSVERRCVTPIFRRLAVAIFFFRCFGDRRPVSVRDCVRKCVQFSGWCGWTGGGNHGCDRSRVCRDARCAAERTWLCGGVEFAGCLRRVFVF